MSNITVTNNGKFGIKAHRSTCKRITGTLIKQADTRDPLAAYLKGMTAATCCKPNLDGVTFEAEPVLQSTPVQVTDVVSKAARNQAARTEAAALKAWEAAGRTGDRPVTVNLDAVNAAPATGKGGKTKAPAKIRLAPGLRFFHDDVRIADSSNKFSCLAWQYTKGVTEGAPRITSEDLRKLLTEAGITAPETSEWSLTLPNGVTLAAKFETAHKPAAKGGKRAA
jgi:hypothetical protein